MGLAGDTGEINLIVPPYTAVALPAGLVVAGVVAIRTLAEGGVVAGLEALALTAGAVVGGALAAG